MIITKSPYRISLFGGGSDRPEFIQKRSYAFCINAAISLHNYVSVKKLPPFHDYFTKVTYDRIERVSNNQCIFHPVFRECIRFAELENEPLEINFISDLPGIGLGLGSSSSMIVNLLYALDYYKLRQYGKSKLYWDDTVYGKDQLWKDAFIVEQDYMKESIGFQDIWSAVYGGIHEYRFDGKEFVKKELPRQFESLINTYGLLFYTGKGRKSSDVFNTYSNKANSEYQLEIRNLAEQAWREITTACRPDTLGYLMRESWNLKKSMSPLICSPEIDSLLHTCKQLSMGERLLGAGGGGCLFAITLPNKHAELIRRMEEQGCLNIPFKVDVNGVRELMND